MSIRWPDLSAYGIRLEAWEGRQAGTNAKIFYLVAFGEIDAYGETFVRHGGKKVVLFPNPKLEGFYFPMPVGEAGARLLAGFKETFPEMQTVMVERSDVMRPQEGRTAEVVAQAIERAKALKPARVEDVDPFGAAEEPPQVVEPVAAAIVGDAPAQEAPVETPAAAPVVAAEVVAPASAEVAPGRIDPPRAAFTAYRNAPNLPARIRELFALMGGYPNAPRFLDPSDQERAVYGRAVEGQFNGFPQRRAAQMVAICPPAIHMPAALAHEGLQTSRSDYWFALKALDVMARDGKAILVLGADELEITDFGYSRHATEFLGYIRSQYRIVDHFAISPALYEGGGGPAHQVLVIDGVRDQGAELQDVAEAVALIDSFEGLVRRAGALAQRWNHGQVFQERYQEEREQDTALPNHAGVQNVAAAGAGLHGDAPRGEGVRGEPDAGALANAVPQRDGVAGHGRNQNLAGGRGAGEPARGALADGEGGERGLWGEDGAQAGDLRGAGGVGRNADRPAVAVPVGAGLPAGEGGGRPGENGANPAGDGRPVVRNPNQDGRVSVLQPNRASGNDAREHGAEGSERGNGEAGRGELRQLNEARRATLAPVNALQSTYTPLSTIRPQGTMIPMNLSVPTDQAMRSLQNRRGDINRFVAEQLQIDVADLSRFFYAEQVDAIAQQLDNRLRGEGSILGDMTGVGKGRVMAALIRNSVLNNRVPIFITEKANLFADIIRDLEGVESTHLINPLIINDGVAIENEMGEVVLRSTDREDIDRVVNSGQMGDFNAVFMTYSQVNREDSPKTRFLAHISQSNDLIIDESHNAGGDSTLGANTQLAVDRAASVAYSSATWAKRPENMAIYSRTRLGDIARSADFIQIMQKGGEPLQEILSSMLAAAGQYIRREHDYRRAEFATHVATNYREQHRGIANRVAEVWAHIAALNGTVFSYIEEQNRELVQFRMQLEEDRRNNRIDQRAYDLGRRMGLSGVGIGSKIGQMVDHLMLLLSADVTAELAIEAIRRGEKPVIALSSTLGEAIKEFKLRDQEAQRIPEGQAGNEIADRTVVCRANYRDLLNRTLDSLLQVTSRDADGNVRRLHYVDRLREDDSPTSARLADMAERLIGRIREMIGELPALPLSPIDLMRHKIEEAGFKVGELTGRSMMVDYSNENRPVYRVLPPSNSRNRNRIINAFNDGEALGEAGLDAVIVNRSAAAGISLHSDATFRDQRKRHMMILQPDPDINVYMQLLGRIFRANMVGTPVYTNVLLDLPTTTRPAAILNRKLAQLSASTTSNRESSNRLDAPDMFNWLGDKVALEMLENDTDMARMLLIDVTEERRRIMAQRDTRLMYRLTARLPMLPTSQQEEVYTRLEEVFKLQLQQLEQAGETPFKTREFDIKARVVHEEVLEEGIDPENPFDAPLYLRVIEFNEKLPNLTHQDAMDMLERAQLKTRSGHIGSRFPFQDLAPQIRQAIDQRERTEIEVSKQFESVQAALADPQPNIFKRYDMQRRFLATLEDALQYGVVCHVPVATSMTEYRNVEAWFLGVTPPKFEQRFDCFSEFQLKFLSLDPDFYGMVYASLSSVMGAWANKEHQLIAPGGTSLQASRFRFQGRTTGTVVARRAVLGGNLLRAVEVAREKRAGTTAVFTNEQGERQRGVIMPAGFQMQELTGGRMPLASTEMAVAALQQHRDSIEARWRAAKFVVAPGANNRHLRIEIVGDSTYVQRPEIAELGLAWQETHRTIKGTRRRVSVLHIQDITMEMASRFVHAVDQVGRVKWSCDATTARRNWAIQWLNRNRELPMAAGMEHR